MLPLNQSNMFSSSSLFVTQRFVRKKMGSVGWGWIWIYTSFYCLLLLLLCGFQWNLSPGWGSSLPNRSSFPSNHLNGKWRPEKEKEYQRLLFMPTEIHPSEGCGEVCLKMGKVNSSKPTRKDVVSFSGDRHFRSPVFPICSKCSFFRSLRQAFHRTLSTISYAVARRIQKTQSFEFLGGTKSQNWRVLLLCFPQTVISNGIDSWAYPRVV